MPPVATSRTRGAAVAATFGEIDVEDRHFLDSDLLKLEQRCGYNLVAGFEMDLASLLVDQI